MLLSLFQSEAELRTEAEESHLGSRREIIAYFSCYFIFIGCRVIPQSIAELLSEEQDGGISLEKKKENISMKLSFKP